MKELQGYYIYYEKNTEMQNYSSLIRLFDAYKSIKYSKKIDYFGLLKISLPGAAISLFPIVACSGPMRIGGLIWFTLFVLGLVIGLVFAYKKNKKTDEENASAYVRKNNLIQRARELRSK